jgi:HAMP domain-containing protein
VPIATDSPLRSIAWRVFAGTAVIVGVVVVFALLLASATARRSADATARRSLEQAADLVAQLLAGRERSLAGGARVFVQGPYFRTLVAERRRDDILDQAFEAVEQLDAAWVFITDDAGTLIAKSDEPSASGDALGGVALIGNALRGQVSGGFGASGDSLLFQATSVPIAIPGRTPLGVLVATRMIDSTLLADIRSATASDVVFYATDRLGAPIMVASTRPMTASLRASVGALLTPARSTNDPFRLPRADATFDGVTWIAQSAALTTAGGDVVGGYVVLRPRDEALATLLGVRRSLIMAGTLGFVLALLAAWFAAHSVTRPVRALALAVRRAADGNYAVSASDDLGDRETGGEIGSLARAFDALLVDLRDKDSLSATTAAAVAVEEARAAEIHERMGRGLRPAGRRSLALDAAALHAVPAMALQRGAILAHRYVIDAVVGRGGMWR